MQCTLSLNVLISRNFCEKKTGMRKFLNFPHCAMIAGTFQNLFHEIKILSICYLAIYLRSLYYITLRKKVQKPNFFQDSLDFTKVIDDPCLQGMSEFRKIDSFRLFSQKIPKLCSRTYLISRKNFKSKFVFFPHYWGNFLSKFSVKLIFECELEL